MFNKRIKKLEDEVKNLNETLETLMEEKRENEIKDFKEKFPNGRLIKTRHSYLYDVFEFSYQYVLDGEFTDLKLFTTIMNEASYVLKQKEDLIILFIATERSKEPSFTTILIDKYKKSFVKMKDFEMYRNDLIGSRFESI